MSSRNDLPSAPMYGGPPIPRPPEPKRRWLLLVAIAVVVIAGLVVWRML